MARELRRNDDTGRYELADDDGTVLALTEFRRDGDRVVLPHTEADSEHKGEGLAGQVVKFALDDIRAGGDRAVVECPYVQHYIDDHPEYRDLVAD